MAFDHVDHADNLEYSGADFQGDEDMSEHRIIKYLGAIAVFIFFVNFYTFSRFTVDDAFITWRYGRNLIEYGIWGYNPILLDLTQAYTNPLYAVISIAPAYLGIDTVLFFKILSIIIVAFFLFQFADRLHNRLIGLSSIAFLFASPSLTIHLMSGLETFAYVAFLGLSFIGLERCEYKRAALYILLAVLCRPEAWLWTVLLPLAILTIEIYRGRASNLTSPKRNLTIMNFFSSRCALVAIVPGIFLSVMLLFHKIHFGYFLPNTFYVKSVSSAGLNPVTFVMLATLGLLPLVVAVIAGKKLMPAVILIYFLPVIYNYSSSDLQMNFNWRFAFQVFAPVYIYTAYVAASDVRKFRLIDLDIPSKQHTIHVNTCLTLLLGFISAIYTLQTNRASELVHLANYYPRALDSHAALGHLLDRLKSQPIDNTFLLGDAGMAAFHSRWVALDNVGLGSALVAHNGVTHEILDEYSPQYVFLHANPDTGVWQRFGYQQILSWMERKEFSFICDIFWKQDYSLRYFARVPNPQIQKLCLKSREANYIGDRSYFWTQAARFPWFYWRE